MDIDTHFIELPEEFPQFPNQGQLVQELAQVLLHFGVSLEGTSNPPMPTCVVLTHPAGDNNGNVAPGGEKGDGGQEWRPQCDTTELREQQLSVQLREVFAQRFTHMFAEYEAFVIQTAHDLDTWLSSREHMQNFDKVRAHLKARPVWHWPCAPPGVVDKGRETICPVG